MYLRSAISSKICQNELFKNIPNIELLIDSFLDYARNAIA